MKSCSILISNYNSFEAIQLCVESIRKYTKYPHKIVVLNDHCINKVDDIYLRDCQKKGWIELYESSEQLTHGGVLNKLMNEICDTELAALLDCDVQIKATGWLDDLIECVVDPKVLAVCEIAGVRISSYGYYVPGFYRLCFSLLNMEAYRDGMQVDWRHEWETREKEPYKNMFRCLDDIPRPRNFNDNSVDVDPGSKLWVKVNYDNPKGYGVVSLPEKVNSKYYHYGHISMISIPNPTHSKSVAQVRTERMGKIGEELRRLRCQP
jgi:hypothetical protein